jgi:hypothetical protein
VRVLETIDARVFRCESSLRTQLRAFLSVSTFARRRSTTRDRFRILFYFLRVFIWYAPLRPSRLIEEDRFYSKKPSKRQRNLFCLFLEGKNEK